MRSEDAEVVRGLLGWSNKRTGIEFYRWDPKVVPRHSREWGELLAREPEIEGKEGSTVIVVVLPRPWSDGEIQKVEEAVRRAVEE